MGTHSYPQSFWALNVGLFGKELFGIGGEMIDFGAALNIECEILTAINLKDGIHSKLLNG